MICPSCVSLTPHAPLPFPHNNPLQSGTASPYILPGVRLLLAGRFEDREQLQAEVPFPEVRRDGASAGAGRLCCLSRRS